MSYGRLRTNKGYKVSKSKGTEYTKPAVPEFIEAHGTMRRVHKGGAHKAKHGA